jgi:hypothetical protein
MEECKHGLDPTWCSLCLHPGEDQRNGHEGAEYGPVFQAHYDGTCADCGFPIVRGQIIRVIEGPVTNRYVHTNCARGGR